VELLSTRPSDRQPRRPLLPPVFQVVLKWLGANPRRVRHVYSFAESHFGTLFREAARARKGAGLDERWIATKPTTFNQPSVFFTLKP